MPEGYHHLTYEQRCQLHALQSRGDSLHHIAMTLGVHRTTIYRELRRNTGQRGYRYKQAHQKAMTRRLASWHSRLKMTPEVTAMIQEKLHLQWSPEQISGWLARMVGRKVVSPETIYKYVWDDKRKGGALYQELRRHGKKYNKRGSGKAGRGCIPGRVDISLRPLIVESKDRLGDWEVDTIVGGGRKGAVVSMVERTSKLTKLALVERSTAQEVGAVLVSKLGEVKDCVHTITSDNGKEFANHQLVSRELESEFYFARPYHSWERGLNEHTNGLVRQYVPKATRLDRVSREEIEEIENLLNNRPRKVLGFLTPIEVFNRHRTGHSVVALQT